MKRGRTASKFGTSDSCRTKTRVTAIRNPDATMDATGTPVWADTQARQVAPGSSRSTCICTACAHTANSMSVTNTLQAHRLERGSNLAKPWVIDDNQSCAALYNGRSTLTPTSSTIGFGSQIPSGPSRKPSVMLRCSSGHPS
jgi:hypothetical protein